MSMARSAPELVDVAESDLVVGDKLVGRGINPGGEWDPYSGVVKPLPEDIHNLTRLWIVSRVPLHGAPGEMVHGETKSRSVLRLAGYRHYIAIRGPQRNEHGEICP